MKKAIKPTFLAFMMLVLTWGIYQSVRVSLADIKHYPIKHWMQENHPKANNEELTKYIDKAKSAIKTNPNNSDTREYLARLYYLRALNNDKQPDLYRADLIQAYIQHKTAIKHRPQWPYSWANLALVKAHLQQLDSEFDTAIEMTKKYGPWEIASNNAIVQALLTHWQQITPEQQATAIAALERIFVQHQQTARSLLKHYKLQTVICPRFKEEKFREDKTCKF